MMLTQTPISPAQIQNSMAFHRSIALAIQESEVVYARHAQVAYYSLPRNHYQENNSCKIYKYNSLIAYSYDLKRHKDA